MAQKEVKEKCRKCKGKGKIRKNQDCSSCLGTGDFKKTIEVPDSLEPRR